MPRRQSPRVDTLWVGVLPLPSRVPPRVGTTCAYLSWFVFIAELSHLPKKPEGEPYMRGTIGGPVDIQLIL
jgi:hypothetical protein